ncbi:hypothetical protein AF72_05740 [Xylella taiwanensis]|uniref:Uncharacterized protein n=1 Tax=Xylella taiwanensis TaxID=1444770 RepID=Z9JK11_9GAMM|nr:hypothetical protein AF72_05740 [Xylella taiwanensis]
MGFCGVLMHEQMLWAMYTQRGMFNGLLEMVYPVFSGFHNHCFRYLETV